MAYKRPSIHTPCSMEVEGRILKILGLDHIYPLERIDWDRINFDKGYEPTLKQLLEEDRRRGIDPWKGLPRDRRATESQAPEQLHVKEILTRLGIQWSNNRKLLTSNIANRLMDIAPAQAKLLLATDFPEIARVASDGDAELESIFRQLQSVMELKAALYFDY